MMFQVSISDVSAETYTHMLAAKISTVTLSEDVNMEHSRSVDLGSIRVC